MNNIYQTILMNEFIANTLNKIKEPKTINTSHFTLKGRDLVNGTGIFAETKRLEEPEIGIIGYANIRMRVQTEILQINNLTWNIYLEDPYFKSNFIEIFDLEGMISHIYNLTNIEVEKQIVYLIESYN